MVFSWLTTLHLSLGYNVCVCVCVCVYSTCIYVCTYMCVYGIPRWLSGKEYACQYRRHKRRGFNPWLERSTEEGDLSCEMFTVKRCFVRGKKGWEGHLYTNIKRWLAISVYVSFYISINTHTYRYISTYMYLYTYTYTCVCSVLSNPLRLHGL